MAFKHKLMKTKWYPRPHNWDFSYGHGLEVGNPTTMWPIIMNDDAMSTPSAYEANPEHASFVEAGEPNCFPDSEIDRIFVEVTFSLTKGALETDSLHLVRCAIMKIATAFKEDLTAIDELSSNEVQDILELTSESTDRQAYPLWNGTDMAEKFTNSALMPTNVPALTTNQRLEGVAFSSEAYYDSNQYETIAGKLRSCNFGLKWFTLTRQKPFKKFMISLPSKCKAINEYTQLSLLTHVPAAGTHEQYHIATDTTNITHVNVDVKIRYYEWHQGFNFEKL